MNSQRQLEKLADFSYLQPHSKGDSLHTTCSASLIHPPTPAFLESTNRKQIFAKHTMMTQYYNKIVSSATSLRGTLSIGIIFDPPKFSLDNTFNDNTTNKMYSKPSAVELRTDNFKDLSLSNKQSFFRTQPCNKLSHMSFTILYLQKHFPFCRLSHGILYNFSHILVLKLGSRQRDNSISPVLIFVTVWHAIFCHFPMFLHNQRLTFHSADETKKPLLQHHGPGKPGGGGGGRGLAIISARTSWWIPYV